MKYIQETRPILFQKFQESLLVRPFSPHPLIRNPHIQTILSSLVKRNFQWGAPKTSMVLLELRGQTCIRAECCFTKSSAPTLLAIHGVGGSNKSPYMQGFLHKAYREGWNSVLLNLYDLNLTGKNPVIFHAGSSQKLGEIIFRVLELTKCERIIPVAVSMGGNMLLKLLGEWGRDFPKEVCAAAVISPLVNLMASWNTLNKFTNRPYRWHFVQGLKEIIRKREHSLEKHIDVKRIRKIKTILEFDELVTSVLGNFDDAFDYYKQASALRWLPNIRIPTFFIHSRRDPILPWQQLVTPGLEENPQILLSLLKEGGHVGFIDKGGVDIDCHWAENRVIDFARMSLEE